MPYGLYQKKHIGKDGYKKNIKNFTQCHNYNIVKTATHDMWIYLSFKICLSLKRIRNIRGPLALFFFLLLLFLFFIIVFSLEKLKILKDFYLR